MARSALKKQDPISERSRSLTLEIAALENQIQELRGALQRPSVAKPVRAVRTQPAASPAAEEPVFEAVGRGPTVKRGRGSGSGPGDASHYNEMGVRKFDLTGVWRRIRKSHREPAPADPRLIHYLAAGSIQGLRPLRYEKRVARNRLWVLSMLLFFALWGLFALFYR